MKKLFIIFIILVSVLNAQEGKEKFVKLFEGKVILKYFEHYSDNDSIYSGNDPLYKIDKNSSILSESGEILYYFDSAKNDNQFYLYNIVERHNYEEDKYEKVTNYYLSIIENNVLYVTPLLVGYEPDIWSEFAVNKNEADNVYERYGAEPIAILLDDSIYNSISKVSLENFLESLFTIFKSENGEISFILSKEKFLEYYSYPYSMYFSENTDSYLYEDNKNNCYFKSGSSKLNKFIEESIKNDMGGEYPFGFGCSFFKNKFVFSYGWAVEYRIMMFIIDRDTLFLMEVPYNHNENQKYGFNGIFKRQ
ncbi:hypothetical protein BFL38_09015 [Brachyspira hampsonii]|uniref:Uncharacterized protein n=1 Tax=Brachyspira hampsonii TaxID=1287055 RepID=A0A1E5NFP8_9SPIR|nr:hypothetical protein [Brachyspira hampsonii]OEJ14961.1 hypothetical protein BFL38_09015 [Brachyspira hampsonii]